ncbi:MAG TPA: hypothetical protein VK604_17865 [Bryobacteraceae bacterium]|nr:hypothetical protein [Bryobacteraceae bacterium]
MLALSYGPPGQKQHSGLLMTPTLTVFPLWALIAAGPIAMILTVLLGILVNNAVGKARLDGFEKSGTARFDGFDARLDAFEKSFTARISSLEQIMMSRFDVVDAKFEAAQQGLLRVAGVIDARLKHLEER